MPNQPEEEEEEEDQGDRRMAANQCSPTSGSATTAKEDGHNGYSEHEDFSQPISLYDVDLLKRLDFSPLKSRFNPMITPTDPGAGLEVRPLSTGDYERGFLELLRELTVVGDITKSEYISHFMEMQSAGSTYYTTVIVDTDKDLIIGAASLILEKKFIHGCSVRGLVEDVVVSDDYRGKQLGKLLVSTLIELGKLLGCYKITLNCADTMVKFYSSFGFVAEPGNANFMVMRVPQNDPH